MQPAETDKLPKLFARALQPVGAQSVQLLSAQTHFGLGLLSQGKQPLFGRKQRQTPRLTSLVQRGLPRVQLAPASLQSLVLMRQLGLGDRGVRVQRERQRLRDLTLA